MSVSQLFSLLVNTELLVAILTSRQSSLILQELNHHGPTTPAP